MFLTDLFKSAKNLFTKDSLETAHSLLTGLYAEDITAEKAGEIVDKVATLATVFIESEEKMELLRYLEDLRFSAELNKEEVQVAVNTVLSLYDKLDAAAKAEINTEKENTMDVSKKIEPAAAVVDTAPVVEDTAPVVEDTTAVTDTAPVADTATETTDYAPGTTGIAGAGSQKMVEDGGFIQELKALIAKYEGTTDAEPEKKEEPVKDAEPEKKDEPAKKDAEPTKDSAPVEQVTATIDSAGANSKGIDSFMKELLG